MTLNIIFVGVIPMTRIRLYRVYESDEHSYWVAEHANYKGLSGTSSYPISALEILIALIYKQGGKL